MTSLDEQEWTRLETEHGAKWADVPHCGIPVGVPFANVPHPLSYGAHLPMRGLHLESRAKMPAWPMTAAERKAEAPRPVEHCAIRANAPHRDSYRADLPLRQFTTAQLVTPSKDDKAAWAARPAVVTPYVFERVKRELGTCPRCGKSCAGIHRRIASGTAVVGQEIAEAFGLVGLPNTVVIPRLPTMHEAIARSRRIGARPQMPAGPRANHNTEHEILRAARRQFRGRYVYEYDYRAELDARAGWLLTVEPMDDERPTRIFAVDIAPTGLTFHPHATHEMTHA